MSESEKNDYVGSNLGSLNSIGGAVNKAGSALQGAGADALSKASGAARDVQARAADLGSDIAERASSVAETQKDGIADRLEGVADTLHRAGQDLRGKEGWLAQLIDKGAQEVGSFAETLRSSDTKGLLGDLQSLARRQPALFMTGSFVAGFALTRVGRLAVEAKAAEAAAQPGEVQQ